MANTNLTKAEPVFDVSTATAEQIELLLKRKQLLTVLKNEAAEAEQVSQFQAVRKAAAMELQKKRNDELAVQASCNHRKEDNKTAVVGSRVSNDAEVFLCQRCAKDWDSHDLPVGLRPQNERIGGPIKGYIGAL